MIDAYITSGSSPSASRTALPASRLSEQQTMVLQYLSHGSATRSALLGGGDDIDLCASASLSRTLRRLIQRGLVEKFYKQFPKGSKRRGEFRWRLTNARQKLTVSVNKYLTSTGIYGSLVWYVD